MKIGELLACAEHASGSSSAYEGVGELFLFTTFLAIVFMTFVVMRKKFRRQERLRLVEETYGREAFHVEQARRS